MPKTILFAAPQMGDLVSEICRRHADIVPGRIDWKRFPDGFPDILIRGASDLGRESVAFLACFDDPRCIFEQMSVIYRLAGQGPKRFKIILPYYPTGTMERIDHEGQVATAASLAMMLSAVPPAGPGPVPLCIYDIHALPIREYFDRHTIVPHFKTGLKLLFKELEGREAVVVFPDDGAKKRFGKIEPFLEAQARLGFATAVCRKERVGDERRVVLSEGEVRGRQAVVIDDLIHSGGTLLACGEAVLEAGAASVSAYVTHAVCENDGWKKFVGSCFQNVWITDSCPATVKAVRGHAPFKVLSLADSIANAIRE